jgi:hypothetical protein
VLPFGEGTLTTCSGVNRIGGIENILRNSERAKIDWMTVEIEKRVDSCSCMRESVQCRGWPQYLRQLFCAELSETDERGCTWTLALLGYTIRAN